MATTPRGGPQPGKTMPTRCSGHISGTLGNPNCANTTARISTVALAAVKTGDGSRSVQLKRIDPACTRASTGSCEDGTTVNSTRGRGPKSLRGSEILRCG